MNTVIRLSLIVALAPALSAQLYRTPVTRTSNSPIGLLVGDVDGDGHLDVVVSDAVYSSVKILQGDGDGALTPVASLAAGLNPVGISIGDVNGDGLVDVVAALTGTMRLSVNRALGAFAFAAPVKPLVPAPARDVVLADVDGDGDLDALTANSGNETTTVMRNTGGTLASAGVFGPTHTGGEDVTAHDLDLDGDLDAVVACTDGFVTWMPNDGTGVLGAYTILMGANYGDSVAVADLDENGWPDLASSSFGASGGVAVWYGLGGGSFSAVQPVPVGGNGRSTDVGDANGDGHVDLVLGGETGDGLVLLGDGTGAFVPKKVFHAGPFSATARLADLDEDGLQDAVCISSAGVGVRLGDGFGGFPEPRHVLVAAGSMGGLTAQDLDADGRMDLVTAGSIAVGVAENLGAGFFDDVATLSAPSSVQETASADLDGDGASDLAAALYGTGLLRVWSGDGAFGFGVPTDIDVTGYPVGVAIGDMGVGAAGPDIVVTSYGLAFDGTIEVVPGDGLGGFLAPVSYAAGKLPSSPRLADIDADGDRDIVYVQGGTPSALSLLRNAGGVFGAPETWSLGAATTPTSLALGDLDEDGDLDAAVANNSTASLSVFLGAGGGFGAATTFALVAQNPQSVELVDIDGDGHLDAVATAQMDDVVCVLPGDGAGALGTPELYVAGRDHTDGVVADYDGDGLLDVAVGEGSLGVALLLSDAVSPWTNLAHGLAGSNGTPLLEPDGSLEAGSTVTLALGNAKPSSTCVLFVGLSAINLPFKGGTLVPALDVMLAGLPTGAGGLLLGGPLPAGLPSGLTLHAQYWVVDAAGPKGFAASNAVVGLTP